MKIVKMYNVFGKLLITRNAVSSLFDSLADDVNLTIDFRGVEFISRSAAHEYLRQKAHFKHNIKEVNMSRNVKSMFLLVAKQLKTIKI